MKLKSWDENGEVIGSLKDILNYNEKKLKSLLNGGMRERIEEALEKEMYADGIPFAHHFAIFGNETQQLNLIRIYGKRSLELFTKSGYSLASLLAYHAKNVEIRVALFEAAIDQTEDWKKLDKEGILKIHEEFKGKKFGEEFLAHLFSSATLHKSEGKMPFFFDFLLNYKLEDSDPYSYIFGKKLEDSDPSSYEVRERCKKNFIEGKATSNDYVELAKLIYFNFLDKRVNKEDYNLLEKLIRP
ncbi:MAG: hypothetical protein QXL16_01500 [Candidatus Micrarchaeaceae archaeon]